MRVGEEAARDRVEVQVEEQQQVRVLRLIILGLVRVHQQFLREVNRW